MIQQESQIPRIVRSFQKGNRGKLHQYNLERWSASQGIFTLGKWNMIMHLMMILPVGLGNAATPNK
jgi:hypothetical protein